VLGLALDGVGYGTDGGAWGGELLRVDGARCERLGHLRELPLAGGDRAAREPWRMAAAALHSLGRGAQIATRFGAQPAARTVAQLLARDASLPRTSSLGRWFDAAAGLLALKPVMSFEGQAAMLLEGLAAGAWTVAGAAAAGGVAAGWPVAGPAVDATLDLLPLLVPLAELGPGASRAQRAGAAADFHAALAHALAEWVLGAAHATGLRTVACGGGCFLNALLARALRAELAAQGLTMLEAAAAPPNDGGLSLGQCWVAQRSGG
jgi:hydrogenase maturation protein HypF